MARRSAVKSPGGGKKAPARADVEAGRKFGRVIPVRVTDLVGELVDSRVEQQQITASEYVRHLIYRDLRDAGLLPK